MVFTRKSAWSNGGDFTNSDLLWYARGVQAMMARPIVDPTSWLFMAAIHGIEPDLWRQDGYLDNDPNSLPDQSVQDTFWNQCQHASWYFLPWHRGYLLSLEAIVRDAVVQAGGPTDWALPYWNYSDSNNPNATDLPPAFTVPTLPDSSPNPLFVDNRFGPQYGQVPLPMGDVSLTRAIGSTQYTGVSRVAPGFGGVPTGFSHGGGTYGNVESLPHNIVHVHVGGWQPGFPAGLMTDPDTAALDPIFYLHHCNIDRLWEVWICSGAGHSNSTDARWLAGPGNPQFIVPFPGGQSLTYTPGDMVETTAPALNYVYDDIGDPLEGASQFELRMQRLGVAPEAVPVTGHAMTENIENQSDGELVGANNAKMKLLGESASTQVRLDHQMMGSVAQGFARFAAAPEAAPQPDRIFLNLEHIRSNTDGPIIDVYVNLPAGANPADHPENFAGTVALFGVRKASRPDQPHGGVGVTETLEITHVIDALHLQGSLDISHLQVQLVPRAPLTEKENVTVDRISIYRQPA